MARIPRLIIGGIPYHILNRANGREKIFKKLNLISTLIPRGRPKKGT